MEGIPNDPVDRLDGLTNEERLKLMDSNLPTSGFSWNLNDEQKQALAELKVLIGRFLTPHYTQSHLLRFLRARGWNIKAAAAMLLNDIEWRKEVGADSILETYPQSKYYQLLTDYWPGMMHGVDSKGIPIWIERIGQVDVKGIFTQVPESELLRFHIYQMEMSERERTRAGQKRGRPIEEGSIVIQDMKGLSWKHLYSPGLPTLKRLTLMDAQHYPECLQRMYIVNTPAIFQIIWNLMKVWIDKPTLAKIFVLSKSEKKKLLAKEFSPEVLPKCMKGACTCDKRGVKCIPPGGKFAGMPDDEFQEVRVKSSDSFEVEVTVDVPNSIICWEFRTEDMDLAFMIKRRPILKTKGVHDSIKPKHIEWTEVLPLTRHKCDVNPDQLIAKEPAVYCLVFDNTHSFLRDKKLKYMVSTQAPLEEEIRARELEERERQERENLSRAKLVEEVLIKGADKLPVPQVSPRSTPGKSQQPATPAVGSSATTPAASPAVGTSATGTSATPSGEFRTPPSTPTKEKKEKRHHHHRRHRGERAAHADASHPSSPAASNPSTPSRAASSAAILAEHEAPAPSTPTKLHSTPHLQQTVASTPSTPARPSASVATPAATPATPSRALSTSSVPASPVVYSFPNSPVPVISAPVPPSPASKQDVSADIRGQSGGGPSSPPVEVNNHGAAHPLLPDTEFGTANGADALASAPEPMAPAPTLPAAMREEARKARRTKKLTAKESEALASAS